MLLKKLSILLAALVFMAGMAVTSSYAQRYYYDEGRYWRQDNGRHKGWHKRHHGRRRHVRHYRSYPRYTTYRYYTYTPRYYTTYTPGYYTTYVPRYRYRSYRPYRRNRNYVSINFGW